MKNNIYDVSALKDNYDVLIQCVSKENPIYLTQNGEISHVLMDVEDYLEYERIKALYQLLQGLKDSEAAS